MITDKELETLMRKVDGAVDKQYNFIKEMKDIKNYLWELKATMQENTIEENVTPLVVEPIIAPSRANISVFLISEKSTLSHSPRFLNPSLSPLI